MMRIYPVCRCMALHEKILRNGWRAEHVMASISGQMSMLWFYVLHVSDGQEQRVMESQEKSEKQLYV